MNFLLHPELQPLLAHGQAIFLVVLAAIIFAECGLLVGFFLPGDSLLFAAGLVAALAGRPSLWLLIPVTFVAAALGDQVGYVVGANVGPRIFTRPDSRLFKQQNVVRTRAFFDRHGPRAIVLARFVPVVRTFTPPLAGVSGMRYRTFVTFNLMRAAVWSTLGIVLGYSLATQFPQLENYLTPILLALVVLSVVPVILELRRHRVTSLDDARQRLRAALTPRTMTVPTPSRARLDRRAQRCRTPGRRGSGRAGRCAPGQAVVAQRAHRQSRRRETRE